MKYRVYDIHANGRTIARFLNEHDAMTFLAARREAHPTVLYDLSFKDLHRPF